MLSPFPIEYPSSKAHQQMLDCSQLHWQYVPQPELKCISKIGNYICQDCKLYLSKVSICRISKFKSCICLSCKLYLSKLQIAFVQIANCICPNCKIYCAQQRKDIIQLALQRLFPEPLNQLFPLTGEKINVIILKKFPPIVRE